MIENIREAFDGIRSHKLRSALTMLGIIIGIASLIAISSTIMGTNEQIKENLVGAGNNTVVIQLYQGDYPFESSYNRLPEYVPILDRSILDEIKKVEQVDSAGVFYKRSAYSVLWDGANGLGQGTIYGADESFLSVYGYVIRAGRSFLKADFDNLSKVVLVDKKVSDTLFLGENPIGRTVEIKGEPFEVIGEFTRSEEFTPVISSIDDYYTYTDFSGGSILIPYTVWPVIYGYDEPFAYAIRARGTDDMTTAGKAVADILNATIQNPEPEVKYKSEDLLEQAKRLQELSGATNRQLILVAAISLLVGGIGVMNIMLVSVTERTPEIGLKKALGAKKSKISAQFLIEAGVLTSIGGILGVAVGVALAFAISKLSAVPIFISGYIVAATVIFSFIIGMVFGAVPAVQASKLNPIDALRRE